MAAQRRYTQKEVNAAIASGEKAPDTASWLTSALSDYIPDAIEPYLKGQERWYRGVGAGAINSVPQVLQLPEFVGNVGGAAYDWATSSDPKATYGDKFYERSVGGAEGADKLSKYVEDEMAAYLAEMPENQRNDPAIREKLSSYIQGSEGFNRLRESQTGTLNQYSLAAQDWVRDKAGLQPTYAMGSSDNLADFIGGAIVPTPSKALKVIENIPGGMKYAARALEWIMPGSSSKTNAVVNVAIPEALDQGLRTASGAPNYYAQTSGLPEELAMPSDERFGGPATSSNTPAPVENTVAPMQEDASAPGPFSIAAAASEMPQDGKPHLLPFRYGDQSQSTTAPRNGNQPTSAPSRAPVVTNPDRDPEGGGGGTMWAKLAGVAGVATLIAAVARGKVPAGALQKVVQDVDSPNAAHRLEPTRTDHIMLEPTLTNWQKTKAGVHKTRAVEDVTVNALDPANAQTQTKINKIVRETAAASPLEIGHALKRSQVNGDVPGLGHRTIPTMQIRMMRDKDMTPPQRELFQKAAVYADRLDSFNLETRTMQQKMTDAQNKAAAANNPTTRQQHLVEAQTLQRQITDRADPNRAFDASVTRREVDNILRAAQADRAVNNALMGMRKVAADFRQAGVHAGMYTQAMADRWRIERPNFIPTSVNDFAKHGDGAKNIGKRALKKMEGRSEPKTTQELFDSHRGPMRTNKVSDRVPVDQVKDVIDSLDTSIHEFHRQHRENRAKQTFTETHFQSNTWGKHVQQAHRPVSIQEFENANPNSGLGRILSEPNVYSYNANGKIYVMRAADSEVARALRNNPSSSVAVADLIRRNLQRTYTGSGMAPLFAPVAAENELGVVRVKLDTKYSKGYLDQLLKRYFPDTTLSKFFDFNPDPTVRLQQIAAMIHLSSNSAFNRSAEALGNHLASQSTLFAGMGHQSATNVAGAVLRTMTDIRTRIQFMEYHGILEHRNLVEANESIFQDWKAAQRTINAIPGPARNAAKAFFNGYIDLVDSVRNSVKYAIASQNLDNLMHKHGGFDRIPNDVMRDYIRDMRYMSGDMTRAIGNEALAKTASAIPFGTNIINSTLHLADGVKDIKTGGYVGARILGNMVVPKALSVYLLTQWFANDDGSPNEFIEHYWNKMPTWQRMSTVPVLSPTFVAEIAMGHSRKPTINDVVFMRQAPEAIPFAETFMSGLQAMGAFGTHAAGTQTWWDMAHAIGSIANVNIPVVDALSKLTTDTDQPTGLMGDSDSMKRVQSALGSLFGMSVDIVGAGYKAGTDSWYRGAPLTEALARGFGFAAETAKQKAPETPLSPLFGGQRRHYTKSQVRDRNMSKFDAIKNVSESLSQEKGNREGGMNYPETNDPSAQAMLHELHSTANAHTMHALRKQRAELYDAIERMDANRGKADMSPKQYTARTEQLKMQIQEIDQHEENTFNDMEMRLTQTFGALGVKDTESAIAYIKSTMHP